MDYDGDIFGGLHNPQKPTKPGIANFSKLSGCFFFSGFTSITTGDPATFLPGFLK
jgi:hypothetical protein